MSEDRDMDITSKWEMDGDSLAVTITATDGTTTIEVCTPGCVNVSVGGWPYLGKAIDIIEDLPARVREVVEVWEREDSIREWLLHQVDVRPVGYGDGEWEPGVGEGGLYWLWYLHSTNSVPLAVTLYLDIELPPTIPRIRQPNRYDVERYLCIEVRDRRYSSERVIPLHRMEIPQDVPVITMGTLRQCMVGDPLNISSLCDTFDLRFPIDRGT